MLYDSSTLHPYAVDIPDKPAFKIGDRVRIVNCYGALIDHNRRTIVVETRTKLAEYETLFGKVLIVTSYDPVETYTYDLKDVETGEGIFAYEFRLELVQNGLEIALEEFEKLNGI